MSALRAYILPFRQGTSVDSIIQGNNIMQVNDTVTAPLTCICRISYIYVQQERKVTELTEKLLASLQNDNN